MTQEEQKIADLQQNYQRRSSGTSNPLTPGEEEYIRSTATNELDALDKLIHAVQYKQFQGSIPGYTENYKALTGQGGTVQPIATGPISINQPDGTQKTFPQGGGASTGTVTPTPTPAGTATITAGTPDPNQYYKVNTGNVGPDGKPVFDIYNKGTGQKLTEAQGLPLFQAGLNVDHIPLETGGTGTKTVTPTGTPTEAQPQYSPRGGIGSKSPGGQWTFSGQGWVPSASGTSAPPAAQPAPKTTAETPATPTTPTTPVEQKKYVQYAGSPDVFDRTTGQYVSATEAAKIPGFDSQVEKLSSLRPGITTEADFAKIAGTNLQLQSYGVTKTPEDFNKNPLQAFLETYKQIWNSLGLTGLKESYQKLADEKSEKITTVNDNPWISEAERSRQITKLDAKYDDKLKTTLALFEAGQKEAQFVTTNALEAYYKEKTFDQQTLMKQMDLAEKLSDVGRNVKEVDGGLFDLETGKWIVPRKATSSGTFTDTQTNTGASNAGLGITDFSSLNPDVQNFFISNGAIAEKFTAKLSLVASGDIKKEELQKEIDLMPAPQGVKSYLTTRLNGISLSQQPSGFNIFSSMAQYNPLQSAVSGIFDWLRK